MHTLIEHIPVNSWESLISIKIYFSSTCPLYSEFPNYLYILESDYGLENHPAGNSDIWFRWKSKDEQLKALTAFNAGTNSCY